MAIYTIGDLHLSFHENKPMSIFGKNWEGHEEKIRKDWEQVGADIKSSISVSIYDKPVKDLSK